MAKKQAEEAIQLLDVSPKTITITIEGTSDLILNKMNDVTARELTDQRKDKSKKVDEKRDVWEEIITSIHWRDGKPSDFSELIMQDLLVNNAPCITTFGLQKALNDAVTQFNIATYSKQFRTVCNVKGSHNLIPISFKEWSLDEKLMSPQRGKPVLTRLNTFSNWSATFEIDFIDTIFSSEQLVNIVNLAGFGCGIGSGRSSGYGRFKVVDIR